MGKLLDVGRRVVLCLPDLEGAIDAGSKALVTIGVDESEARIVVGHVASVVLRPNQLHMGDFDRQWLLLQGACVTQFFIADMHFGSASNAKWRGFPSSEAMDEAIIAAWRERVSSKDVVWVLGDVGNLEPLADLPGEKLLIYGNTDRPKGAFVASGAFQSLKDEHILDTDEGPIFLVHKPTDARLDGMPVLHGHTHSKPPEPDPRFVSVSVDKTGWGPITLAEVRARLAERAGQAASAR